MYKGVSGLRYCLNPANQNVPDSQCEVKFTLLGDFLILAAAAATGLHEVPQLTLSLRQHVRLPPATANSQLETTTASSAALYPEQQAAWAQVKDSLALPIKTALCRAAGLPVPLSLLSLPSELRDRCLEHLQASSLGCFPWQM